MIVDLVGVSLPDEIAQTIVSLCSRRGVDISLNVSERASAHSVADCRRLREVIAETGAHTEISRYDGFTFARDIAHGRHEIRADKGIREAVDEWVYSELNIERCVRAACELGGKRLLLVCKPNILVTSRMWARVTSEVCADYSLRSEVADVEEFLCDHARLTREYDTILADMPIGDILKNYLSKYYPPRSICYIGDTSLVCASDGSARSTANAIADVIETSCSDDVLAAQLRDAISNKS